MPNAMAALPNIGGALCSTLQTLADAHYYWVPCSNAAKMLGAQTNETILSDGPKFAILWGHMEEVLLFYKFFRLSIFALVAKM